MQVNPYLYYNGNCEAAFKYYEKVLGAKIEMRMPHEGSPAAEHAPPEGQKKILHARIAIDGEAIMQSDAPPGHFRQPQRGSVSWQAEDPAEHEGRLQAPSARAAVSLAR